MTVDIFAQVCWGLFSWNRIPSARGSCLSDPQLEKVEKRFCTASIENNQRGYGLVVQCLELPILAAKGLGSTACWGTKIPHAVW